MQDGDAKVLQRCAILAAEALHAESQAISYDEEGNTFEAEIYFQRAERKFTEAVDACPETHLDWTILIAHKEGVRNRLRYLNSLCGAHSTIPVEEHVAGLTLSMDLSTAKSGQLATLDEAGYQLVFGLKNAVEMKKFVRRLLDKSGRSIWGDGEDPEAEVDAQEEFDEFVARQATGKVGSGMEAAGNLQGLLVALGEQPWVLPHTTKEALRQWWRWRLARAIKRRDKLELAVALEAQAGDLDKEGELQEALRKYEESVNTYQYVAKHDDRTKNAQIKRMVDLRIEDLTICLEKLKSRLQEKNKEDTQARALQALQAHAVAQALSA